MMSSEILNKQKHRNSLIYFENKLSPKCFWKIQTLISNLPLTNMTFWVHSVCQFLNFQRDKVKITANLVNKQIRSCRAADIVHMYTHQCSIFTQTFGITTSVHEWEVWNFHNYLHWTIIILHFTVCDTVPQLMAMAII